MRIQAVSVTGQVIKYLKKNIESGKWAVGEKIPSETQMIAELGVSRASIRSALQYFSGLGVLKSYQGRGTILIDRNVEDLGETDNRITSADCLDIYRVLEFRRILEPELCRLAVQNSGPETAAFLEKKLEQMKMYRGLSEKEQFVSADLEFHEIICRASGNPLAEKSLHKVFQETRWNHEQMNDIFGYESGVRYHTAILAAFRSGDAQYAFDIMRRHIQEAMDIVTAMLGK